MNKPNLVTISISSAPDIPPFLFLMSSPITRHQPPPGTGPSQPSQELLYPADVPSLSHAERARTICALSPSATLCTLSEDGDPYGSLVLTAVLPDGDAALLVSEMAEHTKNLRRDPRCSLLIAEDGCGNPLARGRITLVGRAAVEDSPGTDCRDAFLKRNPSAVRYADFSDFAVWRISVTKARYIGGFGRMSFLDIDSWQEARPDALAVDDRASELISTLNACPDSSSVALHFSYAQTVKKAIVQRVDQYGIEFDAETELGLRPIRVPFPRRAVSVSDAESLFSELRATACRSS